MTNNDDTLRGHIRNAILLSEIKKRKKTLKIIKEEEKLRSMLRTLIIEVASDAEDDPHPSTGINFLRDLFKDTNLLSTLRSSYKTLTSNPEQRKSFRAHVLTWMIDTLRPLEATEMAGPPVKSGDLGSLDPLTEDLNIDVVTDADRDKSIMDDIPRVGDEEEEEPAGGAAEQDEESEEDQKKFPQLAGSDTTGRNAAKRIYNNIEKSIVQYYNQIGREDVEDRELYRDYLLANAKLYFNKWENELQPSVEEPTNDEYETSKDEVQDEATGEPLAGSDQDLEQGVPDLETAKAAE